MAVLRLCGASGHNFSHSRVVCFLHDLIILVMLPFLILIGLRHSIIVSRFLYNLPLVLLRVLIVLVLAEIVIVVPTASMVVLVVVTTAPLVVTTLAFPVISIVSIILVIVRAASISVLLIAVVLLVAIISVAVTLIGSRSTAVAALERRLSSRVLGSTAISGQIRI